MRKCIPIKTEMGEILFWYFTDDNGNLSGTVIFEFWKPSENYKHLQGITNTKDSSLFKDWIEEKAKESFGIKP